MGSVGGGEGFDVTGVLSQGSAGIRSLKGYIRQILRRVGGGPL